MQHGHWHPVHQDICRTGQAKVPQPLVHQPASACNATSQNCDVIAGEAPCYPTPCQAAQPQRLPADGTRLQGIRVRNTRTWLPASAHLTNHFRLPEIQHRTRYPFYRYPVCISWPAHRMSAGLYRANSPPGIHSRRQDSAPATRPGFRLSHAPHAG